MTVDVNNIEEAFAFARRTLEDAVEETMYHFEKQHLAKKVYAKIVLNGLRKSFDIEQIWSQLDVKEKNQIAFEDCLLTPEEFVELKKIDAFKQLKIDIEEDKVKDAEKRAEQQEIIRKILEEREKQKKGQESDQGEIDDLTKRLLSGDAAREEDREEVKKMLSSEESTDEDE